MTDKSVTEDTDTAYLDDEGAATDAFAQKFGGTSEGEGDDGEEGADKKAAATDGDDAEVVVEADPDDAEVEIAVGEETRKVPLKTLKALYSQESEITSRHTAATEAVTRAEAEGEKAVAILGALIAKADKAWEPYANINLSQAAQRLEESAYNQLVADMQAAHNDRVFLRQEADAYLEQVRDNRNKAVTTAMAECDRVLAEDPATKGWTATQRTEVTDYAVAQGLPKAIATTLSDPAAIKLIRKAMLYDRAKASAAAKVQPAVTAAKKVINAGAAEEGSDPQDKAKAALRRLRDSRSDDDAAAAFAARFAR